VLLRRARETGMASAMSHFAPRADSAIPPEIAAHHLVTSSMSLIQWWLDQGMPYPPVQMGRIYAQLIVRPTRGATFA